MTYQETLAFIYSKLPSLEKIGWGAYKPGLERIYKQLAVLGNPQNNFKIIHIAGTNGKGSVANLLSSVLQEQGYKVGLFTSPHLKDFRERIRVNGEMVSEQKVIDFVQKFTVDLSEVEPSFFEYTFAMSMLYFSEEKVDFAVVETGLGGRLDCTNIVKPLLSIITNVGLDHEQYLGDTIQKIAQEKAGIIKNGVDVVIGRKQKDLITIYQEKAQEEKAQIHFAENQINYPCGLIGKCQVENQNTVLTAIGVLQQKGVLITTDSIKKGFLNVLDNTGFKGRFQVFQKEPLIICDVAHNSDGVKQLFDELSRFSPEKLKIVWGMSVDKKIDDILTLLPVESNYYWCSANNPRAFIAKDLKIKASEFSLKGEAFNSVYSAYQNALLHLEKDELLLVAGSVFVVADLLSEIN